MSGPKISVYSLTGWARSVVFGQIRCEQQAVACADQISSLLKECSSYGPGIDGVLSRLRMLQNRTGEGSERIESIEALCRSAEDEIEQYRKDLQMHQPHISPKYSISDEAYEEKKQMLAYIKALRDKVIRLRNELDEATYEKQEDKANITQAIQDSIADDLIGVFSFEIPEEEPETSFDDRKRALTNELMTLASKDYPREIISEIRSALNSLANITDPAYLSSFDAVTVKALFKDIEAFSAEQDRLEEEFNELYARYKVLCQMSGAESEAFEYSESAIELITSRINTLEQDVYRQQEQAYISDCVDEVMKEMGYELIGSREVKKRSGKRFKNELFTFNEGTAVNVTYSPDGQIAMELGGLSREDRIPTNEESAVLTEDMETFCGEFAEFERRMLAKGIALGNRIALSPPSAEYATIINLNDYDIDESVQVSEVAASTKKKKTAQKKYMQEG